VLSCPKPKDQVVILNSNPMDEQELRNADGLIGSTFKPSSLLPIARHRESLLYLVEKHPVTIVVGQTGSGKTTQLPQFLYHAGWAAEGKAIAVTQVCKRIICWNLILTCHSPGALLQPVSLPVLQTSWDANLVRRSAIASDSRMSAQIKRVSNF
jgi:hypothetical protein